MNELDQRDKEFIIKHFHMVKELGFVKSNRPNNTGIGKTFEDYMGVVENNLDAPDLAGYEIKSHREGVSSYVTIFTKSPSFPDGANAILRDRFGEPYENNPQLKKLHTSIFATHANSFVGKYSFQLVNDKKEGVLYIEVRSLETGEILDRSCGYTYVDMAIHLQDKLNKLFYVSAERSFNDDGTESFYFNHAEIYTAVSFEKFIKMIDEGLVMYDIRIGSYKSGKDFGKCHDHGSGFRVKEANLHLLYEDFEEID